jgi:hypothetical protein
VKKTLITLLSFLISANFLLAQDDELPPPSSNPKSDSIARKEQNLPKAEDFQGFKPRKKIDWSKFIIEPNFNLSIGQGQIDVGLSPYVGYNVWKGLFLGGGVTYFYTGYRNVGFTDGVNTYYANAKWHTYGGGVFVQYNIWRGFFARTRFEVLHRTLDDIYGNVDVQVNPQNHTYKVIIPKIQKTIPSLLVGAGFNLLRSKNFFMPIMISYNLLHSITDTRYSLYRNGKGFVFQLGFINIF